MRYKIVDHRTYWEPESPQLPAEENKPSKNGQPSTVLKILGWVGFGAIAKEKREQRRIEYEEKKRRQAEAAKVWQLQLEEVRRLEAEKYKQLESYIRQMPRYARWRDEVFEKCGRRCEVCGKTDNLEIHHRKSFGSIIRLNNISNMIQAFECNELWDVNNGSVVCKSCHKQTESYKYRNKKIGSN